MLNSGAETWAGTISKGGGLPMPWLRPVAGTARASHGVRTRGYAASIIATTAASRKILGMVFDPLNSLSATPDEVHDEGDNGEEDE